eukprot:scaffold153345_cov37-Tisochrysis_lutea.AAC.2
MPGCGWGYVYEWRDELGQEFHRGREHTGQKLRLWDKPQSAVGDVVRHAGGEAGIGKRAGKATRNRRAGNQG